MIELSDSHNSLIQGRLSEQFVKYYLTEKGFIVEKAIYILPGRSYVRKKEITKAFKKLSSEKIDETLKIIEDNKKGFPDLICLKEGVISFVEVKSHSTPNDNQEEIHKNLRKLGFKVEVIYAPMKFSCEEIRYAINDE